MTKSMKIWADFETWLGEHYNLNVSDLSWNDYVEYSTKYNNERLDTNETKNRQGMEREGINA